MQCKTILFFVFFSLDMWSACFCMCCFSQNVCHVACLHVCASSLCTLWYMYINHITVHAGVRACRPCMMQLPKRIRQILPCVLTMAWFFYHLLQQVSVLWFCLQDISDGSWKHNIIIFIITLCLFGCQYRVPPAWRSRCLINELLFCSMSGHPFV